jgi:hypothetical protein
VSIVVQYGIKFESDPNYQCYDPLLGYDVKFKNDTYQVYDAIAGTLVNFGINISNTGNIADTYELTPILNSTLSEDWSASGWAISKNVTINPTKHPSIDKGETKNILIIIAIPNNVAGDSSVAIDLKATSSLSGSTYNTTKISVVVKKIRIINVSRVVCDFDIAADLTAYQTIIGSFVLKNNGNVDENVACNISSNLKSPTENWSIRFDKENGESMITQYLPRNSAPVKHDVYMRIPPDMSAGTHEFNITIGVDNVTVTGSVVNVTIGGRKIPALKISTTIQKARSIMLEKIDETFSEWMDSTIAANITIKNKGNAADTIKIESNVTKYEDGTDVPGFTLISNRDVNLSNTEEKRYKIVLRIPAGLPLTLYKVTITATSSDPAISKTVELSFNNQIAIKYDVAVTNIDFSFKHIIEGDTVGVIVSVRDLSITNISNVSVLLEVDGILKLGPLNVSLTNKFGSVTFQWVTTVGNHTLTATATITEIDTNSTNNQMKRYREIPKSDKKDDGPKPFIIPDFGIPIMLSAFIGVFILFSYRRLKRYY